MAEIDITRIAGNIGAMNALNSLQGINKQLATYQTRLATGKRINSAADDPAGLSIASKLQFRSEGLKVALGNIGDAKNLLAVAEAGVTRINDILVQMRNKAAQAASDTMGSAERDIIKTQLAAYAAQIDDIAAQTEWNGNKLIDASYYSNALTFQTGYGQNDFTSVSGLDNLAATGVSNGRDSLKLALKSGTSTAAVVADASDIIDDTTGVSVSGTINSNLSELQSGTYTVQVVANGANSTVRLFDGSGSTQYLIAQNANGTGAVGYGLGVNLSGNDVQVNFGNGLVVNLNGGLANGTYTATVNFTKGGSYDVQKNGDTGGALVSAKDFRDYMTYLDGKLDYVAKQMSTLGAFIGRLNFKEDQVAAAQINVEAAYNRIMNSNMAEEQVNASKYLILQQTATAMLAQANTAPQFLLSLFR
jgi:flagellin